MSTSQATPLPQIGFLRQSLLSVGVKGASLVLGFLVVLVLARVLGEDGYGLYAVIFAWVTVLSIPAQFGLPNLVVRETARIGVSAHPGAVRGLWRRAIWVVLVASAVILVAALGWAQVGGLSPLTQAALLAGLLLIPLRAMAGVFSAGLRGLGRVITGQLPEFVLRPGLFLVLVGGAVWLAAGAALTARDALWLHLAAAGVALVFAMVMLARHAPARGEGDGNPLGLHAMLVSSGTLGLIAGAQVLNQNLDVIMLGALSDTATAGVYKVAASTAILATFALQAINQVLMPRIAAAHARGDRAAMQRLARKSARLILLSAVLATVVLVVMGEWLLGQAFGAGYAAGYPVLVILLVGQLGNALCGSVISILNMTGHERDTLAGVVVACVLNVALNAVLIPLYGAMGAAIATAATMLAWNLILFRQVWRRLGINPSAFGPGGRA